jgi:cytochrome c peroxidase
MVRTRALTCAIALVSVLLMVGVAAAQLTPEQKLGKLLYFDSNLSKNFNQSCASCHLPTAGFADPDQNLPVSQGSDLTLFGGRNAPSAAYAAFSPFFHWDAATGLYVGGQFWDGRVNSLAEQASGPPTNPVEMALPDKWSVVDRLRVSSKTDPVHPGPNYQGWFKQVYNLDLTAIPPYDPALPVPPGVLEVYDRMAKAIGEFEKSKNFTSFSSKYDYVKAGLATFTPLEARGESVFQGKGKCNACHVDTPTLAPDGGLIPPMFTDFTYDNIGVPANQNMPGGVGPVDNGLGGRADIAAKDPSGAQLGKFKVMSLRNIAKTAPYSHNGIFLTLQQIIHFYGTRDLLSVCGAAGNNDPGFATTCWPAAEQPTNMNVTELGSLNFNADQEAALVAFLRTLTDGYGRKNNLPPLPLPPFPPMP